MEALSRVQQGYYLLGEKNFDAAKSVFCQALKEKEAPDAYIGLLLAEHHLQGEEQLCELPEKLTSYDEFNKALACADGNAKSMLKAKAEEQKTKLAQKEKTYAELKKALKEEKDKRDIDGLITLAASLYGYKDSDKIKKDLEDQRARISAEKKRKKKITLLIVIPAASLILIALVVAGILFALPKVGGVRYALTLNGYKAISCDDEMKSIAIEEEINGVKVTAIGEKAFKDCASLESVAIGKNVTLIEEDAFNGCSTLSSVTGTEQIMTVEKEAFKDCKVLRLLRFAENCEIDREAFKGCKFGKNGLKVYTGDQEWVRPEKNDDEPEPQETASEAQSIVTILTNYTSSFRSKMTKI